MESVARSLFELGMPWWEFVLRAVAVYVVVLLMVRLTGKRTVGQFTPFDLLVVVLLGTAVQNSLIGEDTSLLGGLIRVPAARRCKRRRPHARASWQAPARTLSA